jgi:peroxiredoxin
LNTEIYPILVDKLENAQKMEEKYAKKVFHIFYDPQATVANMLHQQVIWHKLGRMPGLLIVDKQGVVRYAYYSDNMHDIPTNDELFEILEGMEGKKLIRNSAEN